MFYVTGPAKETNPPQGSEDMTSMSSPDGPKTQFVDGEELTESRKECREAGTVAIDADPPLTMDREGANRGPDDSIPLDTIGVEPTGSEVSIPVTPNQSPLEYDPEECDPSEMDDGLDEEEEGMMDEEDLEEEVESSGHTTPLPKMPGLAPLPILPDSNVKLESLENTKVAVAQFAENNIANPQDLAFLQSTLYNLQQQQLFQLQLLQTLHQQLMSGMTPSLANIPQLARMPTLPFPGVAGLMRMPCPVPVPVPPPTSTDQKTPDAKGPSSLPSLASSKPIDGSTKITPLNSSMHRVHTESLNNEMSPSEGEEHSYDLIISSRCYRCYQFQFPECHRWSIHVHRGEPV